MSNIFIIILGLLVIFWRPPFKTPIEFKKFFRPVILMLIIGMLLFLGTLKSVSSQYYSAQKATSAPSEKILAQPSAR